MAGRGEPAGGAGGGGDCSLKCPPPVEGGSEVEEAQTENSPGDCDYILCQISVLRCT